MEILVHIITYSIIAVLVGFALNKVRQEREETDTNTHDVHWPDTIGKIFFCCGIAWIIIVIFVEIMMAVFGSSTPENDWIVEIVFLLITVLSFFLWRFYSAKHVTWDDKSITDQNMLRKRTYPIENIISFRNNRAYDKLYVDLKDGKTVCVNSFMAGFENFETWLRNIKITYVPNKRPEVIKLGATTAEIVLWAILSAVSVFFVVLAISVFSGSGAGIGMVGIIMFSGLMVFCICYLIRCLGNYVILNDKGFVKVKLFRFREEVPFDQVSFYTEKHEDGNGMPFVVYTLHYGDGKKLKFTSKSENFNYVSPVLGRLKRKKQAI